MLQSAAPNMPANLENSAVATGLEQFLFQSQRKAMPKNDQTTTQLHSSHTQVMLKILQARLQQYVNRELPCVQDGFRKGRGTRDQIANICWIIKKAREFQKNIYFFALIAEESFLISTCCSLEVCIQMGISLLFSFAFCFSSFRNYL